MDRYKLITTLLFGVAIGLLLSMVITSDNPELAFSTAIAGGMIYHIIVTFYRRMTA